MLAKCKLHWFYVYEEQATLRSGRSLSHACGGEAGVTRAAIIDSHLCDVIGLLAGGPRRRLRGLIASGGRGFLQQLSE
jgi:hypothetical protein